MSRNILLRLNFTQRKINLNLNPLHTNKLFQTNHIKEIDEAEKPSANHGNLGDSPV
jgi:hypothetical protein